MTAPYDPPSVGRCAELACLIEATARKPGNVHPGASFADMTYEDFVRSAHAIAPVMEEAAGLGVGRTVLEAVRETRKVTSANTNLGIVLLLAPLAAVPGPHRIADGIIHVLKRTTVADAEAVYEAIRLAKPGGMGKVGSEDISGRPTVPLVEAMTAARERDMIAEQYANGFYHVRLNHPFRATGSDWETAVVNRHLLWMTYRDTLIARKAGRSAADVAAMKARRVLFLRRRGGSENRSDAALAEFDAWLRADGNRRNPGTSADLTAASLFLALREGTIRLPWGPWEA